MQIEMRSLSSIVPYDLNPRNNEAAVDMVAASIKAFGFRQPIVVDELGVVVVGHTRLKAAHKLGLTEVPVHVAVGLSPEQARAYRIADNQTASIAEWNEDLLVAELAALQSLDVDLSTLGFPEERLAELFAADFEPQCDPDAVPEPPDEPITQPGDLWVLGRHRLLCGNSGNAADVDRLLDGAPIHLVCTDPPYGVAVEPRSRIAIAAGNSSFEAASDGGTVVRKMRAKDRPIANDAVKGDDYDELLDAWFGNISRVLASGRGFYVWGGYANLGNYPRFLKKHGLYFSQAIVWDKQHPVISRKDFMGCFELAFYGWKEGAAHQFFGPNNALDLWHVKKVNPNAMIHLTQKPTELAERAMEYSSKRGENVLDVFGGSGTTLIAAEQSGRNAFLMELDAPYCDVIVQRFEEFTGTKAERIPATTEAPA